MQERKACCMTYNIESYTCRMLAVNFSLCKKCQVLSALAETCSMSSSSRNVAVVLPHHRCYPSFRVLQSCRIAIRYSGLVKWCTSLKKRAITLRSCCKVLSLSINLKLWNSFDDVGDVHIGSISLRMRFTGLHHYSHALGNQYSLEMDQRTCAATYC